jgi:4-amino-4-deoxy-L-arabinose transferase-like glycosyltransferase
MPPAFDRSGPESVGRGLGNPYFAIFTLALLVRLAWVVQLGPQLTWSDEDEFVGIARRLVQGQGFVASSYRANPVLPVVLSGVFRVFGESYFAARILQSVFGALTCVLVARTGSLLLGTPVGVLSGFMLAVYLPHVYLSGVFYVECLVTLLCALTIYVAVLAACSPGRVGLGVACGIAFGVTMLTRTIFVAYLPFLCAALLFKAVSMWR